MRSRRGRRGGGRPRIAAESQSAQSPRRGRQKDWVAVRAGSPFVGFGRRSQIAAEARRARSRRGGRHECRVAVRAARLSLGIERSRRPDPKPTSLSAPRRLRALRASAAICHRALNEANSRPARTATPHFCLPLRGTLRTLRLCGNLPSSSPPSAPSATSHLSFASSAVAIPPEIGKLPSRAAISWPERLRTKRRNSSAAGCIGVPGFWFT